MPGESPTLQRALQPALNYLGFGQNAPKRITTEPVQAVLSDGAIVVGGDRLRASGNVRGVEAGDLVTVLWARKTLAPGVRGVKRVLVLSHQARRHQGTSAPSVTAGIDELILTRDTGDSAPEFHLYLRTATQLEELFLFEGPKSEFDPEKFSSLISFPSSAVIDKIAWGQRADTFYVREWVDPPRPTQTFDFSGVQYQAVAGSSPPAWVWGRTDYDPGSPPPAPSTGDPIAIFTGPGYWKWNSGAWQWNLTLNVPAPAPIPYAVPRYWVFQLNGTAAQLIKTITVTSFDLPGLGDRLATLRNWVVSGALGGPYAMNFWGDWDFFDFPRQFLGDNGTQVVDEVLTETGSAADDLDMVMLCAVKQTIDTTYPAVDLGPRSSGRSAPGAQGIPHVYDSALVVRPSTKEILYQSSGGWSGERLLEGAGIVQWDLRASAAGDASAKRLWAHWMRGDNLPSVGSKDGGRWPQTQASWNGVSGPEPAVPWTPGTLGRQSLWDPGVGPDQPPGGGMVGPLAYWAGYGGPVAYVTSLMIPFPSAATGILGGVFRTFIIDNTDPPVLDLVRWVPEIVGQAPQFIVNPSLEAALFLEGPGQRLVLGDWSATRMATVLGATRRNVLWLALETGPGDPYLGPIGLRSYANAALGVTKRPEGLASGIGFPNLHGVASVPSELKLYNTITANVNTSIAIDERGAKGLGQRAVMLALVPEDSAIGQSEALSQAPFPRFSEVGRAVLWPVTAAQMQEFWLQEQGGVAFAALPNIVPLTPEVPPESTQQKISWAYRMAPKR